MPPKKEDKLLKEINELEEGGVNNALFPEDDDQPQKEETVKTETVKTETVKEETVKTETVKAETVQNEKSPLGQGVIDEKSRAKAEKEQAKKEEKERKAREKAEKKQQEKIDKAKKKEEKAKKKAEEAELARRKAESDKDTYENVPENPGFWRIMFHYLKKLLTGTGLKDVDDYFNAKIKADEKAKKAHEAIEKAYEKEKKNKEKEKELEKELEKIKEEPEKKQEEPEKKQEEPEKKTEEPEKKTEEPEKKQEEPKKEEADKKKEEEQQPEKNPVEKEKEPKKDAPEKKEVQIDLTTHGEVKERDGEKKDIEKMTAEQRADVRMDKFVKTYIEAKGKKLTEPQATNLKKLFTKAETAQDKINEEMQKAGDKGFMPAQRQNFMDVMAANLIENQVKAHPEELDKIINQMGKPGFAENVSKTTKLSPQVQGIANCRIRANTMKAYLGDGDKLQHVVDSMDKAINDKRNSPTYKDDVKKAQHKMKDVFAEMQKKIEEKEKKLNDASRDKELQTKQIEQNMKVV